MKTSPESILRDLIGLFLLLTGLSTSVWAQFGVTEASPNIPSAYTNFVTSYGASGDGITTNTAAINAAILDAASTNGGGTVIIPYVAGTSNIYLCGQVTLKGKTRLQIQSGVTLRMLPKAQWSGSALIYASANTSDTEISGSGTLDGQATLSDWWSVAGTSGKPYVINLNGCVRALIKGITLIRSPKMHIAIGSGSSTNITLEQLTISTDSGDSHNTDGIDIVGKNLLIKDCAISCGDDNIAVGSTTVGLVVTNCAFGAGHGMSFGSSTGPGGISNVMVINCTFTNTDNGLRIKSDYTTGGPVGNIYYYNLAMTNVNNAALMFYGYYPEINPNSVTPLIASTQIVYSVSGNTPRWGSIVVSNLTANVTGSGNAGILWGCTEYPLTNIVMQNVKITAANTFDVMNAYGVQLLNSTIQTTGSGQKTFTVWNGGLALSNTTAGSNPLTITGMSNATNTGNNAFALCNETASFNYTNLYGANPLSLSGGTLTVSNHLVLTNGSVVNLTLGSSNSLIAVRSNLTLNATLNISAGAGFGLGTYTLFTYNSSGTFSGTPALGSTPLGYKCQLDTSTAGQVKLQVSASPLTAATATFYRHSALPLSIGLTDLATNWSDSASGSISLQAVSPACPNGGTAAYDGTSTITYTNAHNLSDQIAYTLSDALGNTAAGLINVQVVYNAPSTIGGATANPDQSVTLHGNGTAGVTYWLLSTTNLALPLAHWTLIGTNTAGGDGSWQFIDTQATNSANHFYRAVEAY